MGIESDSFVAKFNLLAEKDKLGLLASHISEMMEDVDSQTPSGLHTHERARSIAKALFSLAHWEHNSQEGPAPVSIFSGTIVEKAVSNFDLGDDQ